MNTIDQIRDIVKHTASLGFVDIVKVNGTASTAKIETKDNDNTVIIFGDLYQPIVGIDSTVGMSRLAVLKGYLGVHSESALSITTEDRGGNKVPTEVVFDDGAGFVSNYRFMSADMVNEQIRVPPFKGAKWDVTITPSKKAIARLSENYGILGGFEKKFIVKIDAGTLKFNIGSGPTDRTTVPFASDVTGTLQHQWAYPLSQVLAILKLADSAASCEMAFSDMGALKITVDSGLGIYQYIIPAGKG